MASRDALQPVPIKTGIISKAKPTGALAELKLATPSGKNYLIKLVDAKTSSQRMLIYLEGGKTFDTKISLGTYRIRVASGATWYGSQALFGPGTTFAQLQVMTNTTSAAGDTFTFYRSGNTLKGHDIRLIGQIDGTLDITPIAPEKF